MTEICDLNLNGYKIVQDEKHFRFGTDAYLLSHFCKINKGDKVVDMCSGQGIIAVLLCNKVVCNPPYKQMGGGILTADKARLSALHESSCTLEDVIKSGTELLKFSGKMFLCQRPSRLCDITVLAREYGAEVKRIRFVHPYKDAKPSLVLCELQKGAKPEVVIEPPLILYESKNTYSEEYKNIMGYVK